MIKVTTWRPDTCDCVLSYEWDDTVPQEQRVHIIKRIDSACADHQGEIDKKVHFEKVLKENVGKNKALNKIVEQFPHLRENHEKDPDKEPRYWFKEGHEPKWYFDNQRNLVIETDKLDTNQKKDLRALLDKEVKVV